MNDRLRDQLQNLFQRFGRGLLDARPRLETEMWLAAADQSQGMFALLGAIDRKVPHVYLRTPVEHHGPDLDAKLTRRLIEDLGLDNTQARWAVETWRDTITTAPEQGSETIVPLVLATASESAPVSCATTAPTASQSGLPDMTIENLPPLPPAVPLRNIQLDPLKIPPLNPANRNSAARSGRAMRGKPITPLKKGHAVKVIVIALIVLILVGLVVAINSGNSSRHWHDGDIKAGHDPWGLRVLTGHRQIVTCVAVHAVAQKALSGSFDNTVRYWDLNTQRELQLFEGHTAPVLAVAISSNGRHAVSGGLDKTVILWDLAGGRKIRQFEAGPSGVTGLSFAPDGQTFLASYGLKEVKQIVQPQGTSMEWHRDDAGNCAVIQWNVQTGDEVKRFLVHSEAVTCVAFLPDGKRAVSGSFDRALCLFNVENGKEIRRFNGHEGEIFCLDVSPDGSKLLSGSGSLRAPADKVPQQQPPPAPDNSIRLWDLETGQQLQKIDAWNLVLSVDFSHDGQKALSASFDGAIRGWDLNTGNEYCRYDDHRTVVHAARYGPDGRRVLSGGWDECCAGGGCHESC